MAKPDHSSHGKEAKEEAEEAVSLPQSPSQHTPKTKASLMTNLLNVLPSHSSAALDCVKGLSASMEMIMWVLSLLLLM